MFFVIKVEWSVCQEELADRAGVSAQFISFFETGKRQPSLSARAAISAGLGVTMSALILVTEERLTADIHGNGNDASGSIAK